MLNPICVRSDFAARRQRAHATEGESIAILAAAADDWQSNARIEQAIPERQERSAAFVGIELNGIDLSKDRVDQRLAAGQSRFRTIRVAPNDETLLAVTLFAPIAERPIVGFIDVAERQRMNGAVAAQQ